MLDSAGFEVVEIGVAPRLDENSVPHHLVIARRPQSISPYSGTKST
jgi:hypothetical protein